MLGAHSRLKKKSDIDQVFSSGKRFRTGHLLFVGRPTPKTEVAATVIVSKKVAKRAVDRNRLRRVIFHLLKDIWEDIVKQSPQQLVVLVLSAPSRSNDHRTLEQEVQQWQRKYTSA